MKSSENGIAVSGTTLHIYQKLGVSPIATHRSVDNDTVCPCANAAPWIESDLKSYINNWHP